MVVPDQLTQIARRCNLLRMDKRLLRRPFWVFFLVADPQRYAIALHRVAHKLYLRGWVDAALAVHAFSFLTTRIQIHPAARIGERLTLHHRGQGVVIGMGAVIGDDVTMLHQVTLGVSDIDEPEYPIIGNRVVISVGAKLLGAITVGDDAVIGANAVVVHDVPAGAVVVGIPGKVVSQRQLSTDAPGLG